MVVLASCILILGIVIFVLFLITVVHLYTFMLSVFEYLYSTSVLSVPIGLVII